VLRRGDLSFWHFFARCHQEFVRDLAAMEPQSIPQLSRRPASETRATAIRANSLKSRVDSHWL